jgi:pimeloyl-ACP methyl ester carboxylesterase
MVLLSPDYSMLTPIGGNAMRRTRLTATLCTAFWVATGPVQAQQIPAAVVTDPAADRDFPPQLAPITVPSHGVDMDATFYLAGGPGSHGTVLLPHGLPGYETNSDLAQSIRRAGWNVLMFNYRGTWGTAGAFSLSSAIEDAAAAVRYLRDPKNIAKYRLDPSQLVVMGHSFGGFTAGYEASHDPAISAVAIVSAPNLGKINEIPKQRAIRMKRWENQLHPVRGATAASLFAEAAHHKQDWNYVHWADELRSRPILLVAADDQNHADMAELAAALRNNRAAALEYHAVTTDHSFSDRRIALQSIVVAWLKKLKPAGRTGAR